MRQDEYASVAFGILAVIVALGACRLCQHPEEDSYSDRPWNSPRGWEHGLPSGFYEGGEGGR
jgi:hypothetical protein